MDEIGWEAARSRFVDLARKPMQSIFKLYPWEWLLADTFGPHALETMDHTQWIEPIWKMLWSNKALLAMLWELHPGHELLLPAYLDGPRDLSHYVRKPLFGREGAGVQIIHGSLEREKDRHRNASPEAEAVVYQGLASLGRADGQYAVLGSWLVDGVPAGIGIRESTGIVTDNFSRFVPHLFR